MRPISPRGSGRRQAWFGANHHERPAPSRGALRRRGARRSPRNQGGGPGADRSIPHCARKREPVALAPARSLVGREEELDLLLRRWERAVKGEGQFVQIVGRPGIRQVAARRGKFRLKLGETPHTWAEFSSSQLLQNTPLHPIAEWGHQRFGADEPAATAIADLENTLRLIGLDVTEYARLCSRRWWKSCCRRSAGRPEAGAGGIAPPAIDGVGSRGIWRAQADAAGCRARLLEDLHWADQAFPLDLIQALAERGRTAPALHHRDPFRPKIPPALEPSLSSQRDLAEAARPRRRRADGRRARRSPCS